MHGLIINGYIIVESMKPPTKYPYQTGWVYCGSCCIWIYGRPQKCPICHYVTRKQTRKSWDEKKRTEKRFVKEFAKKLHLLKLEAQTSVI